MKSSEKEYFEKIAGVFDTHYNVYSKPAGKLRVLRRVKLFSQHCRLKPGLKVLEIGSGTGEYALGLSKYASNLFCTDISFNMINKAAVKTQGQEGIHFFVSDAENLPFKDNVFDAVVGNSVLHHLNLKESLTQIHRVLKDAGRFAFSEPNMLNPQIFLQKNIKLFRKLGGDTPGETAFTRIHLEKILKNSGFKNVEVRPFDFLHPFTPDTFVKIVNNMGLILERIFLIKEIAGSLLITGVK